MHWWEWLCAAIAVWLFMARWSIRWCRELEPETDPEPHVILSLLFPWFTILGLLPAWLKKQGGRLDEHRLRALVGESRWHRAERLAREHAERCEELGMPT